MTGNTGMPQRSEGIGRSNRTVAEFEAVAMLMGNWFYHASDHTFNERGAGTAVLCADTLEPVETSDGYSTERGILVAQGKLGAADYDGWTIA